MHNIIMNKLKWAIFKKRQLYNSYISNKSQKNWEIFRKQRNYAVNIRRQSVNQYFIERCAGGPKSRDFWSNIKPFLINKGTNVRKKYYTVWKRAGCLDSDQTQVCNTFNNWFVNDVKKKIGTDCVDVKTKHPCFVKLCENNKDKSHVELFSFHPLDNNFVSKWINKLGMKEATGIDSISAKIIKLSHEQILKRKEYIVYLNY